MKKLVIILGLLGMMLLGALTPAKPAAAAACGSFLGFPAWYNDLTVSDTDCTIRPVCEKEADCPTNSIKLSAFIWIIAMNVIQILLMLVSYLSVGFVMFGGVKYMTSQGSPDKIAGAKKTIMAAIIGLVITILAASIISFLRRELFI